MARREIGKNSALQRPLPPTKSENVGAKVERFVFTFKEERRVLSPKMQQVPRQY